MTPAAATEKGKLSSSAYGTARSTVAGAPLNAEDLRKIHAYWRATTYLMLGMIYLEDNPLLKDPLKPEHIKKYDLDMIFLAGPGHGAPGVLAPVYLEGAYSEIYTDKCEDEEGLRRFFKQFSFPGGIGSHCPPET